MQNIGKRQKKDMTRESPVHSESDSRKIFLETRQKAFHPSSYCWIFATLKGQSDIRRIKIIYRSKIEHNIISTNYDSFIERPEQLSSVANPEVFVWDQKLKQGVGWMDGRSRSVELKNGGSDRGSDLFSVPLQKSLSWEKLIVGRRIFLI